ncbi:MAG: GNAT family N-acetyltransferase [Candidatus Eremiobacteraeota bacterium]|nr:GNAT family N-acetyltransferase [Candidatus Eremiobacteraeota bacterium]
MRLRTIPTDAYARDILPVTAPLWAGTRDLATYKKQTSDLARSTYGRRNYRTVGLFDGGHWLASCKRYQRIFHFGAARLRAVGFGAVFTPSPLRGRGYATAMLALLMDEARAEDFDVAYLFSDIRPAFYRTLGFIECPSHDFTMRSDALPAERIRSRRIDDRDWGDVARCFRRLQSGEPWRLERSPAMWSWVRMRLQQRSQNRSAHIVTLAAASKGRVVAYVIGDRRPRKDTFFLDELGWSAEAGSVAIGPLLRNAAGDLRKISGWLPPSCALAPVHKYRIRARKDAILMMAPFSARGRRLVKVASAETARDAVWSTDHI